MNLQEQKAKMLKFFDACQMIGLKALSAENAPALLGCIGLNQPEQPKQPELKLEAPAPIETINGFLVCHLKYDPSKGVDGMVEDLENFCAANSVTKCRVNYWRSENDPKEKTLIRYCVRHNHGYKLSGGSVFSLKKFYNKKKKADSDKPSWVN